MCVCVCAVSYTHLRAHETKLDLVCRLLLEKGGVGKSVCSMLLIDHLLHPVEAVEDTKNEAEK